ncbi:MAG: selenide, water dikinase SelD [Nannocystaceae bacterium]
MHEAAESPPRLTQLVSGGGCAAKLRLGNLAQLLGGFSEGARDVEIGGGIGEVLVGSDFADDAAVVRRRGDARPLVMTTDVITPLVDDPETFGAIAACNAISDVYAMGGRPLFALSLVFFADDKLPLSLLAAIQRGAAAQCARAGVAIVGGHSVRDDMMKFGLAVVGELDGAPLSNRGARPGQALVLTKALGVGVITTALKVGEAPAEAIDAAVASMTTLNDRALACGRAHGVTAATDVTGFGLLGHLNNIVRGSGVSATLAMSQLPLLPGALALATAGYVPGGSRANLEHLEPRLRTRGAPDRVRTLLAADAQTSGGLLLCVDAPRAPALVAALRDQGSPAAVVGRLEDGAPDPVITLDFDA